MEPTWLQIILGTLILMTSIYLIIARNPVVSAIMLMCTLFLTGAMYFSMGFYFIGAVQILIYAGAISVLFIFIVMLLDMKPSFVTIPGRNVTLGLAIAAALLLLIAILPAVVPVLSGTAGTQGVHEQAVGAASARAIALLFLSKYMIPFQATGLLILAAVMGVAVLGRQNKPESEAQ